MGEASAIEGDGNALRRGLSGDSGDEFEDGIPLSITRHPGRVNPMFRIVYPVSPRKGRAGLQLKLSTRHTPHFLAGYPWNHRGKRPSFETGTDLDEVSPVHHCPLWV